MRKLPLYATFIVKFNYILSAFLSIKSLTFLLEFLNFKKKILFGNFVGLANSICNPLIIYYIKTMWLARKFFCKSLSTSNCNRSFNMLFFKKKNINVNNKYSYYSRVTNITKLLSSLVSIIPVNSSVLILDLNKTCFSLRLASSTLDFYYLVYYLFSNSRLGFKMLLDLSTADFSRNMTVVRNKYSFYFLYYIFYNLTNMRFILKLPTYKFANCMLSLTPMYFSMFWSEREVWDMFGVYFIGNKDHRRLLTDYGFTGFPLRKSFPTAGFIELYYSDILGKISYIPVSFRQEYRRFLFV